MATMSLAAGLARLFADALQDERTVVLGDHVARLGGFGGVFAGLADTHQGRVLDLPISDRATLGAALGMALAGQRVVVELADSGRVWASLEVLAEAAAIARKGEFPVRLAVRVPAGGQAGPVLDRPAAEALAAIDGLTVVCPATAADTLGAWNAALSARGPVVVLEPRTLLTRRADGPSNVRFGSARAVRSGRDVLLVSWGSGVSRAVEAADALHDEAIEAGVLDLLTLSPLDADALGAELRACGRMVLVEAPEGGLTDRVLHTALQEAFLHLEAPLATAPASVQAITAAATRTVLY